MKIALASDVHLEFGRLELFNDENADVLVLSGDICTANDLNDRDIHGIMGENTRSNMYHTFFQECSERFPHVVYVAGNHEHYNGDYAITLPRLKEKLGYLKNLHILDKEHIELDGYVFVGGTLWTDMNKEDALTLYNIKDMMNDFRIIKNSNSTGSHKVPIYKKDSDGNYFKNENGFNVIDHYEFETFIPRFNPEDAVKDHYKMMDYLKIIIDTLGKDRKYIVCGHHSPSKLSTKPRYEKEVLMNGAYSSDLSEFILDRPCIKLWTHGHTHHIFDYMIGSTRIVCNPRGYVGYEVNPGDFNLTYLEV